MAGVNSASLGGGAFLSNNKEQSGVDQNSSSPTPVWTAGTGQPTPAVEACWQMVEAGQLAARRRRSTLRLFHQGRTLLLKHLPRDVTEHEIREMLLSRGVQTGSITLSSGSGAGPNWARAGLVMMTGAVTTSASAGSQQLDGFGSTVETIDNVWEDWKQTARDRLDGCTIRGHKVSLCPSPTENLLCVARLPRDLLDEEFRDLVAAYGEIRRCFLLYSDKTGESKGYGFVEYASREGGQRAKTNLDGRRYEGQLLACDWLDPSIVTMAGLHSKLLYVDCLPDGFRDMSQFRKLFSQVANPPYCQIALKGGAPQDWGLVEFSQAQEAEDTMRALDGKLFYNAPLRLNFFIPGVRAINIYMKLINETCQNRGKEALLPEPPSDTVFHQLQNLTKQNPAFVHSLQNIILTQIQHLNSSSNSASSSHPNNNCPSNGGSSRSHHQYQQQPSPGQQASNASLAASAQAALSMLLAAQQPTGCNPTVKSPPQPVPPPIPPVSRIPVGTAYHHQHQHRSQQTFPNHCQPMGSTGVTPPALNINVPPPPFYQAQSGVPPPPPPPPSVIQRPPPSTNLQPVEQLQQTLSALLGTLSSAVQSLSSPQPPTSTPQQTAAGALLGLLLQMVQQQPQPVSPPLTISTHEMAGYNHVGNGGGGGGLLTVAAPPSGLPTYLHHCNSYPPPPIQQPLSSPSSSCASSAATSTSTLTASGTWNHVLGQVRTLSSGPSSLGSTGSRGSSPTSSSSPSTSPARHVHPPHMNNASSFVTPVQQQGTKRKYNGSTGHNNNNHVLPSPEPSPEANYVGQHSQGLGGHYADSYFKRKKRN